MRCFRHMAELIRRKRINHKNNYSQAELSKKLGHKNGQFISNVERALCSIPLKRLKTVCEVLDITPEEIKKAYLLDHETTLESHLKGTASEVVKKESKVATPVTEVPTVPRRNAAV